MGMINNIEEPKCKVKELWEKIKEALDYIRKGDPVQASEKLYKVAEDAIKILAQTNRLPEWEKAQKEDNWWTKLLDRAAERLRTIYGEEVGEAWTIAYRFRMEGCHEESLTVDEIIRGVHKIVDLVKLVEKELSS